MEQALIAPDELPDWITVDSTVRSPDTGWGGVSVRGWTTQMLDAEVPAFNDHLLVAWLVDRGVEMSRRTEGQWQSAPVGPGVITLQPRGADSRWVWEGPIDVLHVYLSPDELAATAGQMYERDVAEVDLAARIDVEDPLLDGVMMRMRQEAAYGGPGSRLLVESLATELSVVLMRRHVRLRFREAAGPGTLSDVQLGLVRDYVAANLTHSISLDDLAGVLSLSRFHFSRVFRRTTGITPHEYVVRARLARARNRLRRTTLPLGAIAADCGYTDQSHMTRTFRQRLGVTPSAYRTTALS